MVRTVLMTLALVMVAHCLQLRVHDYTQWTTCCPFLQQYQALDNDLDQWMDWLNTQTQ